MTSPSWRDKTYVVRNDYRRAERRPATLFTMHGGGHSVPGPKKPPFRMGRTDRGLGTVGAVSEFVGFGGAPR